MREKVKNKKQKREKTNQKINLKNKNGITLIALVITIIVLLILAAVSIATLTGENGLLTRANDAKTETEEAKEDELRRLTALEAATNLEDTIYIDNSKGEEKTVTIPAGFAVSQVEGENVIDDGLVIIDQNGNEFVWVPVNQENFDTEFVRRAGYRDNSLQDMINYGEANVEGKNINGENQEVKESNTTVQEAEEMYASVKRNEGFYIGRYEAGTTASGGTGIRGEVVSKKRANVYNYIKWGNGMTDETGGAVELSRNFARENGYTTVTSTLCYGVQWDRTISWIDPEYDDFTKDSSRMGWYSNNYSTGNPNHQTGINLKYENKNINNMKKKIYDLAGNISEWTMESYGTNNRVIRGGSYNSSGYGFPASFRDIGSPSYHSNDHIGFRVTLYLNN